MKAARRRELLRLHAVHAGRFEVLARERRRRLGPNPRLSLAEPSHRLSLPGRERQFGGTTDRELAVLELVADGLENAQIGERLHISVETVKSHIRSLLGKLEALNRTHAVAIGLGEGLIPLKRRAPALAA